MVAALPDASADAPAPWTAGAAVSDQEVLTARILIVDQPVNARQMAQVLAAAGYDRVSSTSDPSEVLALHQQHDYDLILLDLQIPGVDSFGLLGALRGHGSDTCLPVVVVTTQPDDQLRALEQGARDFITNPLDLVEVRARMRTVLEWRLLNRRLQRFNEFLEARLAERTEELRASEERYRCLTELASDWYWEQDEQGHFTKVSGPVREMLGFATDQVAATGIAGPAAGEANGGWNPGQRQQLLAFIAAREAFLDLVLSRRTADGLEERFQVSGEPMFNRQCRFIGYRGVGVQLVDRP